MFICTGGADGRAQAAVRRMSLVDRLNLDRGLGGGWQAWCRHLFVGPDARVEDSARHGEVVVFLGVIRQRQGAQVKLAQDVGHALFAEGNGLQGLGTGGRTLR